MASSLSQAVDATLAAHLDEDATEYVTSLLSDDPCDEDAREAVLALVSGSIDDEDADAAEVVAAFFQLLDFGSVGGPGDDDGDTTSLPKTPAPTRTSSTMSDTVGGGELRKLTESVTLKEKDVTTFASGLSAAVDTVGGMEQQSTIAEFYANGGAWVKTKIFHPSSAGWVLVSYYGSMIRSIGAEIRGSV